jgi:hypothetical protein
MGGFLWLPGWRSFFIVGKSLILVFRAYTI